MLNFMIIYSYFHILDKVCVPELELHKYRNLDNFLNVREST